MPVTGLAQWLDGNGWGVVAPGFLIWLSPDVDQKSVLTVHARAIVGTFDEVVLACQEAIGPAGSFAVAFESNDRWTLGLIGRAECRSQEPHRVTVHGPTVPGTQHPVDLGVVPWLRVGSPDVAEQGTGLPLAAGVVRCGAVQRGTLPIHQSVRHATRSQPGLLTGAAASVPPATPAWRASVPVPAPPAGADNPFAQLWGHTMRRPVEEAAVREVRNTDAAEVVSEVTGPLAVPRPTEPISATTAGKDHDRVSGATLVGGILDEEVEVAYGTAVASTGESVPISGRVVIGRAPALHHGEQGQVLKVRSPDREISRNHVALKVRRGTVVALDLGSNNGTRLRRGADAEVELSTTLWTAVRSGDLLDLGEGIVVSLVDLP